MGRGGGRELHSTESAQWIAFCFIVQRRRAGSPDYPDARIGTTIDGLQARMQSSNPDARQQAEDHYYAALDLFSDGNYEGALQEYRKSIDSDPTFTEAMHGMARALQDLERYDEAIAVAQRIAELDPDDVLAHTSLSVLYQKKGMIPEAEAEGNKARILGWKQQLKKTT